MAAFADKQRQPSFFIESGTGKEKQKKELIFMGLELYYKIRTKAVGKNYAQISSKTSADHEELDQGETELQFNPRTAENCFSV